MLATRSPYRPNPLGLSLVRLARVERRVLHVLDIDMLDGTPCSTSSLRPVHRRRPDARSGWLAAQPLAARDPGPRYAVQWSAHAQEQLTWLSRHSELPLRALAEQVLSEGPAPHPYRRIRQCGDHLRLAVKDFRLRFVVEGSEVSVLGIESGYRKRVLAIHARRRPSAHRSPCTAPSPSASVSASGLIGQTGRLPRRRLRCHHQPPCRRHRP